MQVPPLDILLGPVWPALQSLLQGRWYSEMECTKDVTELGTSALEEDTSSSDGSAAPSVHRYFSSLFPMSSPPLPSPGGASDPSPMR